MSIFLHIFCCAVSKINQKNVFIRCRWFVKTLVGPYSVKELRWKWALRCQILGPHTYIMDAAGHTNRRLGSAPEPAAASARRHGWRLGAPFPSTATSPRRSREGSFAARSREPCRSLLKQSAPVVRTWAEPYSSYHLLSQQLQKEQGGWPRTEAPTGTACSSGASPTETAPTRRVLSGLRSPVSVLYYYVRTLCT
jgi:hypothetical protein